MSALGRGDGFTVVEATYASIKTLPPISEIIVAIRTDNDLLERTLDLQPVAKEGGRPIRFEFAHLHEFFDY